MKDSKTDPLKALIIGLDGATFDICQEWLDAGLMPNLSRIMARGAYGELQSTMPPISPAAWTTMLTGKNPGQHGVFVFHKPVSTYSSEKSITSGADCRAVRLWRLINEAGLSWGSVGVPWSYPPDPVDGFILACGVDAPAYDPRVLHPSELFPAVAQSLPSEGVRFLEIRRRWQSGELSYEDIDAHVDTRCGLAETLYARRTVDVLMVVIDTTDIIQHLILGSRTCRDSESGLPGDGVRRCYEAADRAVGRLLELADDETIVIVLSDHGSAPLRWMVNLPQWFAERELVAGPPDTLCARGRRGAVAWAKRWFPRWVRPVARRAAGTWGIGLSEHEIDYTCSRVFMPTREWLQLNLKGREPRGIVEPGAEYESLLRMLQSELPKLQAPTGGALIQRVHRPDAIYRGPFAGDAFDLVIEFADGCLQQSSLNRVGPSAPPIAAPLAPGQHTGDHTCRGIIAACGGTIAPQGCLEGLTLEDIAPTMLYLLGLPIPSDMDGRCVSEIATAQFRQANAVCYRDPVPFEPPDGPRPGYSDEDQETVRDRLRGLGYID